jgi:hydroxypyruvate isomerase
MSDFELAVCSEMVFTDLPIIDRVRRIDDAIGEIQLADLPGRCEPGTGEINCRAIARALRDMSYRGTVGLEAWASVDSAAALAAFRDAFAT